MIIPIGVIIRRCSIFLILVEVSHNPLNRIDIETFVVYWPFDNFCLLCSTKVVSMECTAQSHRNTASVGPSSLTMPLQRRTFFCVSFFACHFHPSSHLHFRSVSYARGISAYSNVDGWIEPISIRYFFIEIVSEIVILRDNASKLIRAFWCIPLIEWFIHRIVSQAYASNETPENAGNHNIAIFCAQKRNMGFPSVSFVCVPSNVYVTFFARAGI